MIISALSLALLVATSEEPVQQSPVLSVQFTFLKCTVTSAQGGAYVGHIRYFRVPERIQPANSKDNFGEWDQEKRGWYNLHKNISDVYSVEVSEKEILVRSKFFYSNTSGSFFHSRLRELRIDRIHGGFSQTYYEEATRMKTTESSYYGACEVGKPNYKEPTPKF